MQTQNIGVLALAILIVFIIGLYALIYPGTPGGQLALGALMPLAGAIGTFFFHTASQTFLGTQLQAQRAGFVQAITGTNGFPPKSSTPSSAGTSSVASTSTPQAPSSTSSAS